MWSNQIVKSITDKGKMADPAHTAACVIQRATRSNLSRRAVRRARQLRLEQEEQKRYKGWNSGWGYDTLRNLFLCNATSKPAPRMLEENVGMHIDAGLQCTVITSYEGDLDEVGRYSGQGTAAFINGSVYKGVWLNGYMHGHGLLTWADGTVYRGPFVNGEIQGKGTLKWPNGDVYEGEVLRGLRHGRGKHVMDTSSEDVEDDNRVRTYDGEWYGGKKHGWGLLLYTTDGKERYDGEWFADTKCGQGTMASLPPLSPTFPPPIRRRVFFGALAFTFFVEEGRVRGRGRRGWREGVCRCAVCDV